MDEAGWTDEVTEEAEQLLPILVAAGYAAVDDVAQTWRFTKAGRRAGAADRARRPRPVPSAAGVRLRLG